MPVARVGRAARVGWEAKVAPGDRQNPPREPTTRAITWHLAYTCGAKYTHSREHKKLLENRDGCADNQLRDRESSRAPRNGSCSYLNHATGP